MVDEPGLGITERVLPASLVNGAMAVPASLVNGAMSVPASFVNGAIAVPASLDFVCATPPTMAGVVPVVFVACAVAVFVPVTGVLVAEPPVPFETKDPAEPSLRVA